jgi:hypothetical protein
MTEKTCLILEYEVCSNNDYYEDILENEHTKIFVLDEEYSIKFKKYPLTEFNCRCEVFGDEYMTFKIILTDIKEITKETYDVIIQFYGNIWYYDEIKDVLDRNQDFKPRIEYSKLINAKG